jgi:hypothetical protein
MNATLCRDNYLLFLEHAAVYVENANSTTELSAEMCHCLGEAEARTFYMASGTKTGRELGWSNERFGRMEWEKCVSTLNQKLDMYSIWLSK